MTRKEEFDKNYGWQKLYFPQIYEIIKNNITFIIKVEPSSLIEDMKDGFDFVVNIEGGNKIAVRLRRQDCCPYRDFTIRSHVPSGKETELQKIKKNDVDYYLYGWVKDNIITEYVFLNINSMRKDGIFERSYIELCNNDDTRFIIIPLNILSKYIIINKNVNIEKIYKHKSLLDVLCKKT
ncbi:MAG: hypothetical protein WA130_01865 [Candidatus Methanoperedens sp.]